MTSNNAGPESIHGDANSISTSEAFQDWEPGAPMPSLRKEPEPVYVQQAFPLDEGIPKLGLDDTVELFIRVLGAHEVELDLGALSAALKAKLKKPPSTTLPGVELLTRDVKGRRSIRSSAMDTSPSPFHPRVRSLPVCSVGDTSEAEMKSYGLAALARLAITQPSAPRDPTGGTS